MRSFATIVLALVLATAAFACGGKSSGSSTTPATGASMGGASYGGATYAAPEGGGNPCGAMADPCGGGE